MQTLEGITEIAVLPSTRTLFVRTTGDLTISNSTAARNEIRAAWDERPDLNAVILDLWETRHLDSSGVGTLLELASHAGKSGFTLRLCHVQPSPRRLLDRTGLSSMFEIYETVEAGLHNIPREEGK